MRNVPFRTRRRLLVRTSWCHWGVAGAGGEPCSSILDWPHSGHRPGVARRSQVHYWQRPEVTRQFARLCQTT